MPDSDDDFQFLGFDQFFSTTPNATLPLSGLEPMLIFQGNTTRQVPSSSVASLARTRLMMDTTFYVSTTGSDVTGTGTLANPWKTPQHTWDTLGAQIDAGNNSITVQFADGTYVGGTIAAVALGLHADGIGTYLTIRGNLTDPSKVKFTDTGSTFSCLDIQAQAEIITFVNITFQPQVGGFGLTLDGPYEQVFFNGIGFDASLMPSSTSSADCVSFFGAYQEMFVFGNVHITGNWNSIYNCNVAGGITSLVLDNPSNYFFHGSVTFATALLVGGELSSIFVSAFGIGLGSFTGAGYLIDGGCSATGLSHLTGGGQVISGYSDDVFYGKALQKSGLPATSDVTAGSYTVIKDTSGGGVYLAYNDAGTIKKVALT